MRLDDAAWTSRWRRRSVAEKTVLCLGLLLVAATTGSPLVAALVGAVVTTLALGVARVPARAWGAALLGPLAFVLVGALTIAVTADGPTADDLWRAGPVGITRAAAGSALLVALRATAATSALLLLAATTPVVEVIAGLRRAGVPDAVVDVAAVTYRMIFGLLDAARAIGESQRGRLGYATGRAARRSIGGLVAAVLVRAWVRAGRLEDGLAGRGGVASVPLVPARPVSIPFVLAAAALVTGLGVASAAEALR